MSDENAGGMILGVTLGGALADLGAHAGLAQRAGADFVFVGAWDNAPAGPVGADPLSLASYLSVATRSLGVVSTVPWDWAPFNVARALASLDVLCGGRCGWAPTPDATLEPDRALEHLDVVQNLFDSWDDDALPFDKSASIFADRHKIRRIRHAGAHFTVDGPLNAPRPLQGWPVLFQRPGDPAASQADVLVFGPGDPPPAGPPPPGRKHLLRLAFSLDTAEDADALVGLLTAHRMAGAFSGVLLDPADPARDIARLGADVVPALRALELIGDHPAGATLRQRLALPRPANAHTLAAVPA